MIQFSRLCNCFLAWYALYETYV